MNKNLLNTLIFLFFGVCLYAQTSFEKGYFITNSGNKVVCYIKNKRWLSSPDRVSYQTKKNSEVEVFDTSSVSEFKVGNGPLFIRVTADFPVTNQFKKDKGTNPKPSLQNKTVFVERLNNGKASLYVFKGDGDRVYLLQVDQDKPFPLLYKQYISRINDIHENNIFRRQLLEHLSCESANDIQTVEYNETSLKSYVESYNRCMDPTDDAATVGGKERKAKTRLLVFGGLMGYKFQTIIYSTDVDFERKISPTLGLEMETILPFNNNKWSIFVSGQYASFTSNGTEDANMMKVKVAKIELSQCIFNLGGRHYMFINDKSSIFIDLGAVFDYNIKAEYEDMPGYISILSNIHRVNFGGFGGFGYSIGQKYYLSAKLYLSTSINRDVMDVRNLERFEVAAKIKL